MMRSDQLQLELVKYLNKTLLNEIKSSLKIVNRENIYSFTKIFKIKLDEKIIKEIKKIDSASKNINNEKLKNFYFILHNVEYLILYKNEDKLDKTKIFEIDNVFKTVYGYLSNIKNIGEWVIDEFEILEEENKQKNYVNTMNIKLCFTKNKEI